MVRALQSLKKLITNLLPTKYEDKKGVQEKNMFTPHEGSISKTVLHPMPIFCTFRQTFTLVKASKKVGHRRRVYLD